MFKLYLRVECGRWVRAVMLFTELGRFESTQWSQLTPAPNTTQSMVVDIINTLPAGRITYIAMWDGHSGAIGVTPVPISNVNFTRYACVRVTNFSKQGKQISQELRELIRQINGRDEVLHVESIELLGRGPVLGHPKVLSFGNIEPYAPNDEIVYDKEFVAERAPRFRPIEECRVM